MKRSPAFYGLVLLMLARLITLSSCANIIPPSGGKIDSLPPKLVLALPKDSATNVSTRNITLTFDEYVTLQSVQQFLIVSPNVKNTPFVDNKLRNVTIRMRDSLEPNTTYSFDFGDALRDVNEGNIAKNFNYVFSTGNHIDNNTYRGKVILAETGKIDSTLIVALHRNLSDTAVFKLPPRYYTRLNGKGEFIFKHLPPGTFNVYVFPSSFNNTYSDSTRPFAFKNTSVVIGDATPRDTLFAYNALKEKPKTAAPAQNNALKPGKDKDKEKEDKRLRVTFVRDNGQQDLLTEGILTFNRKLGSFDSSKFVLYDTSYNRLRNFRFRLDTSKTQVILSYNWKENSGHRVIVAKDAVADSAGVTLSKADTISFVTKKEAEYGSLRLRFGNLDLSKHPVLLLVQNEKIVEAVPLTESEFRRKLMRAGNYDLRILFDTNRNGVWDPGNFAERKQPESVLLIPKVLVIRGNWDNEVNISL